MDAIWRVLGFSECGSVAASDEETSRQRRIDEIRALLADITVASAPAERSEDDECGSAKTLCCA